MINHDKINNRLPYSIWTVRDTQQIENQYLENNNQGLTKFNLMERAGKAAFHYIYHSYPHARKWLVLCGPGNNGGDGYIVACLAQAAGIEITLLSCANSSPKEAQKAQDQWLRSGGKIYQHDIDWPKTLDLIIDGLLGNQLNRIPTYPYNMLIKKANESGLPIFSLDIPSGLSAETGATPGDVIKAAHTITFITLKPGLFTGKARKYVGKLHYQSLGTHEFLKKKDASIKRMDANCLPILLPPRCPISHKRKHGRLLIIGGDIGTAGAVRLAGEAALRTGSGLVKILTKKFNIIPILSNRPELMVDELRIDTLDYSLNWADIIVVGPGLGQRNWGQKALSMIQKSTKPMLWDADALIMLSKKPDQRHNRIITPHPGEAAKLLNISIAEIESNRLDAAKSLANKYGGIVVLKGAGTIIASYQGDLVIADVGNAGMASGGMGDVLSGIIGSLLGQKLSDYQAACAGCIIHGAAADLLASKLGMRGILASDIFSQIHLLMNPDFNKSKKV
ncbi:MAG: bifunctional ADP-dependent NAD(P)H-hydrate dehydratase/NAD(P)H-hydrate epimerase [Candidatus Dasytiphilus stammeri]